MSLNFVYTARRVNGGFVSGRLGADSKAHALAHLRARDLCVTSLEPHDSARGFMASIASVRPMSRRAQVAFFRSFATLIGAGVPIRRAVAVTIDLSKDSRLVEALESIATDIEGGASLSSAMQRRPSEFPPLFVAMVGAGELGGTLDQVLLRLAELLERDRALRQRTSSALAYPTIVITSAVLVVMLLVANVVPTFATMFSSMHVALPLTTRILIALGVGLQSPRAWLAGITLVLMGVFGWRLARRNAGFAEWADRNILALPIYGMLMRRTSAAQFARTLGTLLSAGVALIPGIAASREVVENARYRRELLQVGEEISSGESVARALSATQIFDQLIMQLIYVGEESGTLDSMLLRIAQYYEIEVETTLSTLSGVLEPVLILVLGAVVGTIVASILIPLYSIIGSIK